MLVAALALESNRRFSRASFDPFTCFPGDGKGSMSDDDLLESQQSYKDLEQTQNAEEEVVLVDGIMPDEVQSVLGAALDSLCPFLASTPSLQDKTLRTVFSVGVDIAIVDSSLSAYLDPLTLTPSDLLSSDKTDSVFGEFMIPKMTR